MKRLMPQTLITFLQQNPNCLKADLFVIGLKNGQTLYATDGFEDITVPVGTLGWGGSTQTFSATTNGAWSRGAITSEASFTLGTNTMDLTLVPQQGTPFPNVAVGMLSAAFNGLFDAASVAVYTAYFLTYGNVSNGIETKLANAVIVKCNEINRFRAVFSVADPLYFLNLQIPARVFSASCPWSYGDSNCNPVGGIQTQTFTAATGTTQFLLVPNSVTGNLSINGYYTQGVVRCSSGTNGGLSQSVKFHAGGNMQMTQGWLVPPVIGDTFVVTAGCDKTLTTCSQKFLNQNNFGGATAVPVPSNAL